MTKWQRRLFTLLAALGFQVSCAKGLTELAPFPCAQDGTCPSGFVCISHVCGITPDLARGALDLASRGDTISFLDINRDMDEPALGCTSPARACHGGAMPDGVMRLAFGGQMETSVLRANYMEAVQRVDKAAISNSLLLTKPLATRGDVPHQGGKTYFTSEQDPTYLRWLLWARCGAPLNAVPRSTCP